MSVEVLPLSELQYQLSRDPQTYRTEFEQQFNRYLTLEQSFSSAPSQHISSLEEILLFLSQVIHFYPDCSNQFGCSIIQVLLSRAFGMHPEMRMAFLKAFMRMKTKNIITLPQAVDVSFKLYRCKDKEIRTTLRRFLISDINRMNKKQKITKLNTTVITFLSKMIKDNSSTVAREAVIILLSLFKRNVWNDARTANLIAESCLMKNKKVYVPALQFFLGKEALHEDGSSDSDSEVNEETKIKQLRLGHRVCAKTKGRRKRLERSIKNVHKEKERKIKKKTQLTNFHAISLLHDSQLFAEKLFHKLERCSDRFEIRLLILDLISRLIGLNKLILLNFYPFIQRYLRPHQKDVTHLLLYCAQASHDQVPPDVIQPVIRVIADNFITERASNEAIAVGLNSVREICARCPYAITENLLSDLIQYRTYRNKNVVAAARSIIKLYRQINPAILPRKERGRLTESQLDVFLNDFTHDLAINYGQSTTSSSIPGSEIIALATESLNLTKSEQITKHSRKKTSEKSNKQDNQPIEIDANKESNECDPDRDDDMEKVEDDDDDDDNDDASESDDSWESCSDDNSSDSSVSSNCDNISDAEMESKHKKTDKYENSSQDGLQSHVSKVSEKNVSSHKNNRVKNENDDSDDEWIDVANSSSGENSDMESEVVRKLMKKTNMDSNVLKTKALEIASTHIFSQEEFKAMRIHQQSKHKRFASYSSACKKIKSDSDSFFTIQSDEDDNENGNENNRKGLGNLVSMSAITRLVKKPRQTKAERMETIEDGRVGRDKYGFKINRMNPHASTTNREKLKCKTFQMIKHKVKQKSKRSFKAKQIALKNHLTNLLKRSR